MGDEGRGIIMIGAGGHAKVCIELFRAMGESVDYCIGDHASGDCLGVAVLDGDEHIERLAGEGYRRAFIAIGANALRAKLAGKVLEKGFDLVSAVSPRAVVSPSARVGRGVAIMAGAVINAEADIGDLAIINTGTVIDHECRIGTSAHVAPQCGLAGNVKVGAYSFLGVGCKVIPEVTVGDGCIIGAGTVVICDIPSNTTAVGVPARLIRHS